MVRLNSSMEQLNRLSEYRFPKGYASALPNGFKMYEFLPRKHYEALCSILKNNKSVYGITGGRGAAKSVLLSTIGMLLAMNGDGDIAVLCKTQEQCRFAMETFLWVIRNIDTKSDWKRYLAQSMFVYGESTKYEQKIRFINEQSESKIRCIAADKKTKFIFVESAEDIDFNIVKKLVCNTVVSRKLIATFQIYEAGFFDTQFYEFIKNYPIYRFTCFDIPHKCLGANFYKDARLLNKLNPRSYIRNYLGTVADRFNKPVDLSKMLNLFKFKS